MANEFEFKMAKKEADTEKNWTDKLEDISDKLMKVGLVMYAGLCIYCLGYVRGHNKGVDTGMMLGTVYGYADLAKGFVDALGKK